MTGSLLYIIMVFLYSMLSLEWASCCDDYYQCIWLYRGLYQMLYIRLTTFIICSTLNFFIDIHLGWSGDYLPSLNNSEIFFTLLMQFSVLVKLHKDFELIKHPNPSTQVLNGFELCPWSLSSMQNRVMHWIWFLLPLLKPCHIHHIRGKSIQIYLFWSYSLIIIGWATTI